MLLRSMNVLQALLELGDLGLNRCNTSGAVTAVDVVRTNDTPL